jgi:hypothetical protein
MSFFNNSGSSPTRKPPVKRLYTPGLGGVPHIDHALDEKNQEQQKAREQDQALASAELQIDLHLAAVKRAMTNAQRQSLLRKRRAQAKLNAKLAVHRRANEKETAAAIQVANETSFESALKELHELNAKVGFSQEEWAERMSALIENFYPTQKTDKLSSMSRGSVLTGAPRGFGRLITGGYDSAKLGKVDDAAQTEHSRVRPRGAGADHDETGVIGGTRFVVNLGQDSDEYKLTAKQKQLERLIGKHRVLLETLHKEDALRWHIGNSPEERARTVAEDTRMKIDFLERVRAGLIPSEIAERVVPLIERDLRAEISVTG